MRKLIANGLTIDPLKFSDDFSQSPNRLVLQKVLKLYLLPQCHARGCSSLKYESPCPNPPL
jgi:hypothetical protein